MQAYKSIKESKPNKLWILYFFVFGILTLLEGTVLFPVKYLLNLICTCIWCISKALFAVWLYHPSYRGALLLHQLGEPHLAKVQTILEPTVGKALSFVGIPTRKEETKTKEN